MNDLSHPRVSGVVGLISEAVFRKREQTDVFSRGEQTEVFSEGEQTEVFSKGEQTEVFSDGEQAEVFSKVEQPGVFSKGEQTDVFRKGEQTEVFSKGEQTEVFSKEQTEVFIIGKQTEVFSKGEETEVFRKEEKTEVFRTGDQTEILSKEEQTEVFSKGKQTEVFRKRVQTVQARPLIMRGLLLVREGITGVTRGRRTVGPPQVLKVIFVTLIVSSFSLQHVLAQDDLDDFFPEITASPYFMSPGHRNLTTTVGQTAYLHCRVAQLTHPSKVSWIRKKDLKIMSSGLEMFTKDQRFQVLHSEKSENWTLQIKYSQLRDSGIYECQVNTVPKISMAYTLNVVEMRATIVGPEYVKAGSTISLTCQINQVNLPGLVYWYHNNEMLDYDGQVKIVTTEDLHGTLSHLTISKATLRHSGNYTC